MTNLKVNTCMKDLPSIPPSQIGTTTGHLPPAEIPQVPSGRWPTNQRAPQSHFETICEHEALCTLDVPSSNHSTREPNCGLKAEQPLLANHAWNQETTWMQLERHQQIIERLIVDSYGSITSLLVESQQNLKNQVTARFQMQQAHDKELAKQSAQKGSGNQLWVCPETLHVQALQQDLGLHAKHQAVSFQPLNGGSAQSEVYCHRPKARAAKSCGEWLPSQVQTISLLETRVDTANLYAADDARALELASSLAEDLPEPAPVPPPPPLLVAAPSLHATLMNQQACAEHVKPAQFSIPCELCSFCGRRYPECSCPASVTEHAASENVISHCMSHVDARPFKTRRSSMFQHKKSVAHLPTLDLAEPAVASAHSWVDFSLLSGSPLSRICMVISMTLILTNTIFIGVEMDINIERARRGERGSAVCETIDRCFVGAFVLELGIKILVFKGEFTKGSEGKWNVFDTVLVLVSLVDTFTKQEVNAGFFRFMRLVRFVRAARILRVLRCIRALRLMVASIICSLVYLLWTLVMLVVVLYTFSILMLQGVQHFFRENHNRDDYDDITKMYGSVGSSMLTLFMAITSGVDWIEALKPLRKIAGYYDAVMVIFISFIMLGLLNVLTAVFVESAGNISHIDKELAIQQQIVNQAALVSSMKSVFSKALEEGTTVISGEKLNVLLESEEVQAHLQIFEVGATQAKRLFQLLDMTNSGQVEMDEFVIEIVKLKQSAKGVDIATVRFESRRVLSYLTAFMKYVEDGFADLHDSIDVDHRKSHSRKLEEYVVQYGMKTQDGIYGDTYKPIYACTDQTPSVQSDVHDGGSDPFPK